jgi:hypothetical protein
LHLSICMCFSPDYLIYYSKEKGIRKRKKKKPGLLFLF